MPKALCCDDRLSRRAALIIPFVALATLAVCEADPRSPAEDTTTSTDRPATDSDSASPDTDVEVAACVTAGCHDDEDPCTELVCDPVDGCVSKPVVVRCDDGQPCTDDLRPPGGSGCPTGGVVDGETCRRAWATASLRARARPRRAPLPAAFQEAGLVLGQQKDRQAR